MKPYIKIATIAAIFALPIGQAVADEDNRNDRQDHRQKKQGGRQDNRENKQEGRKDSRDNRQDNRQGNLL